jgi:hypothetical protein
MSRDVFGRAFTEGFFFFFIEKGSKQLLLINRYLRRAGAKKESYQQG